MWAAHQPTVHNLARHRWKARSNFFIGGPNTIFWLSALIFGFAAGNSNETTIVSATENTSPQRTIGSGMLIGLIVLGAFVFIVLVVLAIVFITIKKRKREMAEELPSNPIDTPPTTAPLDIQNSVPFQTLLANVENHPCGASMSKLPNKLSTIDNREKQVEMERCFALSRPFAAKELEVLLSKYSAQQVRRAAANQPPLCADVPTLLSRLLVSRWRLPSASSSPSHVENTAPATTVTHDATVDSHVPVVATTVVAEGNASGIMSESHLHAANRSPLSACEQMICGFLGIGMVSPVWLQSTLTTIQCAAVAIPALELTNPDHVGFRHLIITKEQNTIANGYGIGADTTQEDTQQIRLFARFYRDLAQRRSRPRNGPVQHCIWAPRMDARGNVFYYDTVSRNATWDSPKMQDLRIRQTALGLRIKASSFREQKHTRPEKGDWVVVVDSKHNMLERENQAEIGEVLNDDSESGDGAPFFVQFRDGTRKWLRENQVANCPGAEFRKMMKAEERLRKEVERENTAVAQTNYGRFLDWDNTALKILRNNSCFSLAQNPWIEGNPNDSGIETKKADTATSPASHFDSSITLESPTERVWSLNSPRETVCGPTVYETDTTNVNSSSSAIVSRPLLSSDEVLKPTVEENFSTVGHVPSMDISPEEASVSVVLSNQTVSASGSGASGAPDPDASTTTTSPTVEMIIAAAQRFGACRSDTNTIMPSYEEASRMFNAGSEKYIPIKVNEDDEDGGFFNLEVLWCRLYAILLPAFEEASRLALSVGPATGYLDLGDMVDTTNAYGICAVSFNTILVMVVIDIIRDHELPGLADVDFRCPNSDIHDIFVAVIGRIFNLDPEDQVPGTVKRTSAPKARHINIRATTMDIEALINLHRAPANNNAAGRVDGSSNGDKLVIFAYSWRTGALPGNFILDDKQERTPGSTRATDRSGEYIGSASAVLQLQDPFVNENISGKHVGFW